MALWDNEWEILWSSRLPLLNINLASEEIDRLRPCGHLCLPVWKPLAGGWANEFAVWFVPAAPCSHGLCLPPALWFPSSPSPSHLCPYKTSPSSPTDSQCWSRALSWVEMSTWSSAYIPISANWRLNLSIPRLPGANGDCPLPLLVHGPACPLLLLPLLSLPVGSLTCTMA